VEKFKKMFLSNMILKKFCGKKGFQEVLWKNILKNYCEKTFVKKDFKEILWEKLEKNCVDFFKNKKI
jgi:hypothetical protein